MDSCNPLQVNELENMAQASDAAGAAFEGYSVQFDSDLAVVVEAWPRLAESVIKELTGGDSITARRVYEDFWQFSPTHKIWLATNHKPQVSGTDTAIWRRLVLIPFSVFIPEEERDRSLLEKLQAELPGILAWCVQGCIDWQKHGLQKSPAICDVTARYRIGEDVLQGFFRECCVRKPHAKTQATVLLNAYRDFSGDLGMSQRRFGELLSGEGIDSRTVNGRVQRLGIGLKTDALCQCEGVPMGQLAI